MDLAGLSARRMCELATTGETSPSELVEACLGRIEDLDESIGAFLGVEGENARERAEELEKKRESGAELGRLFGVPVGLKDNLSLAGWELTCGSRILEGHRASFTATAVQRMLDADAIPIVRTNMDEFGFGSSTEHSAWRKTRNPWNLERIPGGSSGGSAAAVAARMVPIALGSDTGGSIRQPAALCGVTGLKPTYGRVSRFGLVAFGSSLDQIGPLTRSADDAALVLSVIAGRDPRDATTLDATFTDGRLAASLGGVKVGVPNEYFDESADAGILTRVREACQVLEELGAKLVDVSLPTTEHAISTYYLVATSEASSNLARFDGLRYAFRSPSQSLYEHYVKTRGEGFGDEAKRRILLGVFALSAGYYDAHYLKALKVRTLLRQDFERAFEQVDVIVGPTTPIPAYRLGETVEDPLLLYLCDLLTAPANLAGIPAISVPCGVDNDGMPVGLQIQGPVLGEDRILRVASAFQEATKFHELIPSEVHP